MGRSRSPGGSSPSPTWPSPSASAGFSGASFVIVRDVDRQGVGGAAAIGVGKLHPHAVGACGQVNRSGCSTRCPRNSAWTSLLICPVDATMSNRPASGPSKTEGKRRVAVSVVLPYIGYSTVL